jgi:hypothetical protein
MQDASCMVQTCFRRVRSCTDYCHGVLDRWMEISGQSMPSCFVPYIISTSLTLTPPHTTSRPSTSRRLPPHPSLTLPYTSLDACRGVNLRDGASNRSFCQLLLEDLKTRLSGIIKAFPPDICNLTKSRGCGKVRFGC